MCHMWRNLQHVAFYVCNQKAASDLLLGSPYQQVDDIKEAPDSEEVDMMPLILEELNNLVVIIEVGAWDLPGEVGGGLEVDMALEVDEIHKELVDLSEAIPSIKCVDREGSSSEGGNIGHGVVGGGGHVCAVVVVAAGKVSNCCRTGFWVVWR